MEKYLIKSALRQLMKIKISLYSTTDSTFRVVGLRQLLAEASQPEASACNTEDGGYSERRRLLDDAKTFVSTVKECG